MIIRVSASGLLLFALLSLAGCSSTTDSPRPLPRISTQSTQPAASADMSKPVALAGRDPITFATIAAPMAELAGAQALEEAVLDRMLAQRAQEQGVTISPQQLADEQRLFVRTLADEANLSERDAATALDRVRASRGLGPIRYNALLTRNATLRALVAQTTVPTQEQLDQELAIATGPRYRVRIMTSPSQSAVANAREQVLAQPIASRSSAFGNLATSVSADASAARGGLIESISTVDSFVPGIIRSTIATLPVGEVSSVLVLNAGFAIVLMESPVPPLESDSPAARDRVAQRVTLRLQRLQMDRLARELLASANITVLDDSLSWSRENSQTR
jgi:hypothetical protein